MTDNKNKKDVKACVKQTNVVGCGASAGAGASVGIGVCADVGAEVETSAIVVAEEAIPTDFGHNMILDKDTKRESECIESNKKSYLEVPNVLQISNNKLTTNWEDEAVERGDFYHSAATSFHSEIMLLDINTKEAIQFQTRLSSREEFGTQRVYKKTSPNCVLTLYLPTREITLSGNKPTTLRGIVYVDPKAIQGYRIYAQLTLTFRYGREDEEVMGLRFCNEAIMSLHQVWPNNDEFPNGALNPLQEALIKRLGDGSHPFTLTLSPQAPPSVQLVPAKRYYGAPIGTSYDVRCFIADKTDAKFHRRASVKMGVRVIYRADVNSLTFGGNFSALVNNSETSPPIAPVGTNSPKTKSPATQLPQEDCEHSRNGSGKQRKSERGDSFPKIRLSPKSFRFSGRFGRSKSEIEKYPTDPFYHYSKSFQEYDNFCGTGPVAAVDKPFLLQDGKVSLRASLDKSWYTHGEEIRVTINIRNESRKTVRKIRVCAIQHVDVCMFNNGKFKNVVADSDADNNSPADRHVLPGDTLNVTIILKPQRGPTKNWIALEDTLQRSTEPDEITGYIAASAVRSFNMVIGPTQFGKGDCNMFEVTNTAESMQKKAQSEDRNVFAIYVSYYIKVKLLLSSMGGELSLKLPFVLVHVKDDTPAFEKLTLKEVSTSRRVNKPNDLLSDSEKQHSSTEAAAEIEVESKDNLTAEINETNKLHNITENNSSTTECAAVEYVHVVQIHRPSIEDAHSKMQ